MAVTPEGNPPVAKDTGFFPTTGIDKVVTASDARHYAATRFFCSTANPTTHTNGLSFQSNAGW